MKKQTINELFELPFFELVEQARTVHKKNFPNDDIELCALLSIKTGNCPEDCAYCPQSGHFKTNIKKEKLYDLETVIEKAKIAKTKGVKRFCMGAAWKTPPKKDFPKVIAMIKAVKDLGLETCVTLGALTLDEAEELKAAGLDYYNHNLDSSKNFYKKIITTRTYQQRLETLNHIQTANLKTCCGGILGMGETRSDRVEFLFELSKLKKIPESIPINQLIAIKGTPLEHAKKLDAFEFIKTIAAARILFPQSRLRLSAGRERMAETTQALCFMAGANSIFYGDVLLTAKNPSEIQDKQLMKKLKLNFVDHAAI